MKWKLVFLCHVAFNKKHLTNDSGMRPQSTCTERIKMFSLWLPLSMHELEGHYTLLGFFLFLNAVLGDHQIELNQTLPHVRK